VFVKSYKLYIILYFKSIIVQSIMSIVHFLFILIRIKCKTFVTTGIVYVITRQDLATSFLFVFVLFLALVMSLNKMYLIYKTKY